MESIKNFIVTGIPRSGTSLLCNLLNHCQNVCCINELPEFYDVSRMPQTFEKWNDQFKDNFSVPMRTSKQSGEEITDTQIETNNIEMRNFSVDSEKPMALGSKINVPYLFQMEKILSYGYPVVAMVRHPAFVIASWHKNKKKINEYWVMDEDFDRWQRYKNYPFRFKERILRQLEIYIGFIRIITSYRLPVIEYEYLVKYPEPALKLILDKLEIQFELIKPLPKLKTFNDYTRFDNFSEIYEAIATDWHRCLL